MSMSRYSRSTALVRSLQARSLDRSHTSHPFPSASQSFSSESRPSSVRIVEVGARDGLQAEKNVVSVEDRVTLCKKLIYAGVTNLEVGSMVSPKWVPSMANSADVVRELKEWKDSQSMANPPEYVCLTPNMKGFEQALEAGAEEVAIFVAASETFSQKVCAQSLCGNTDCRPWSHSFILCRTLHAALLNHERDTIPLSKQPRNAAFLFEDMFLALWVVPTKVPSLPSRLYLLYTNFGKLVAMRYL